ncbi:MAG: hypothetical protein HGA55_06685 [Methanoregulaceae archaeon]|nr:hypothetical protein [Methanoregulaceae archaeon]
MTLFCHTIRKMTGAVSERFCSACQQQRTLPHGTVCERITMMKETPGERRLQNDRLETTKRQSENKSGPHRERPGDAR